MFAFLSPNLGANIIPKRSPPAAAPHELPGLNRAFALRSASRRIASFDDALQELVMAFRQRHGSMALLQVAPLFDPLRPDPRFELLVRRMNFPD